MERIRRFPGDHIYLGRQGEHLNRQIVFDISAWEEKAGAQGSVQLLYRRPGESVPYLVELEREGGGAVWSVTATDTALSGSGGGELRYCLGEQVVKSAVSVVTVEAAMGAAGQAPGSTLPGGSGVKLDDTLTRSGYAAEAKAVGRAVDRVSAMVGDLSRLNTTDRSSLVKAVNEILAAGGSSDSSQNVTLTPAQSNALDGMFKVCAFIKEDVSAEYNAFKTAFGITDSGDSGGDSEEPDTEKTLAAILATYGGGDVVVGTALNDLTGIVVTAIYSDGTSEAVTGYTLSGEIAEGENGITASYGGKTATFTVVGVSAEIGVSNETTWTDGVAYTYAPVRNEYVENGEFKAYNEWDRTPYLYCEGASKIRATVAVESALSSSIGIYNAFYDANKAYLSKPNSVANELGEVGSFVEIEVPAHAVYFIASKQRAVISGDGSNPPYLTYTPYE